ncbi:F0F1 ATP synthase subunit B [Kutzneria chonburiensis]|uniref:ATP synthase subunit b n=1 Tax=Kutzneria chonburiensis TaxID=1483604 RepID=A0ABV6MV78_9PSEU|nr:F0F1 ATP synthase subunit B [Kutzneria chonburiensis]
MDEVLAYVAELVAFAIIVFFIVRYVVPPVRKAMQAQQEKIRIQIERAAETEKRLAVAEAKFADAQVEARQEAAKIRDNARADAQRIVEELRAQADREVERIRLRGEEELANRRQHLLRELHAYLGQRSVEVADRLVEEHLADAGARSATVDRFLEELDAMSARDAAAQPSLVASKGES